MAETIFELSDGDDTIHVKPCRVCGEKPVFYWTDSGYSMINLYVIRCPNCDADYIQEWGTEHIEMAWNDWNVPLDKWNDVRSFDEFGWEL